MSSQSPVSSWQPKIILTLFLSGRPLSRSSFHRHDCTECRPFVIDHAPSVHLPVRNRQIIRRIIPVVSCRHDIEVSKNSDELFPLSDFRPADAVFAVFRPKARSRTGQACISTLQTRDDRKASRRIFRHILHRIPFHSEYAVTPLTLLNIIFSFSLLHKNPLHPFCGAYPHKTRHTADSISTYIFSIL